MSKLKVLVVMVLMVSFTLILGADTPNIPGTPAGKMLTRFLRVIESGDIENFVANFTSQKFRENIPAENQVRFLSMVHRMHGGFTIFKILKSTDHVIEVIARSKKRKDWRRIVIQTGKNDPGKITGMDIDMATAPEEYLATLPKIKIERTAKDDSIVSGALAEKIDKYMTKIESTGYSGALGIIKDGKVILSKGYGYADREKKKIFDRKTVFTIGSIAKQFTGAAMVKLEAMGKISFKDPIGKYFKGVPEDKKHITIHQLLTHTAGFPGAIGDDYEKISRENFVKRALAAKLKLKPGEQYFYSNVGFSLAGVILEKVSGKSYEAFLREHILQPAGLAKTGYVLPRWNPENIVVGYRADKKWGKPTDLLWAKDGPGWHLKCNGGILSTIDDMLDWGRAILANKVFSKEEKKTYLTPYVPEGPEGDCYYAYGWVRMKSGRGTDVITHNGGNPYIQNDMFIYPDDGVIMYITSNNGQFSAIDQSGKILRMIFNKEK
jgi:CubicO group peptidase (beta-lactamase class C family)